jgi:hypothetical protein
MPERSHVPLRGEEEARSIPWSGTGDGSDGTGERSRNVHTFRSGEKKRREAFRGAEPVTVPTACERGSRNVYTFRSAEGVAIALDAGPGGWQYPEKP